MVSQVPAVAALIENPQADLVQTVAALAEPANQQGKDLAADPLVVENHLAENAQADENRRALESARGQL